MKLQDLVANARQSVYESGDTPSLAAGEWEYVLGVPSGEHLACDDCGNKPEVQPPEDGWEDGYMTPCLFCGGNLILVREWREVVAEPEVPDDE